MNWRKTVCTSFFAFSFLLFGCKVQRDYGAPEVEQPASFSATVVDSASIADIGWWRFFNDSVLVDLIEEGLNNNLSLQNIAIAIHQSQLQLNITRAQLYPAINYGVSAQTGVNNLTPNFDNSISAIGQVSYTVDVWRRIANQNEAAFQAYLATEMAGYEIKATLVSQIAELYFTLRDIDNKIDVAVNMQQSLLDYKAVMQARYDGGFISKVDLNQISISVSDIDVTLQALFRARKQVENALSTALGSTPKQIPRGLKLQEQVFPSELPVSVPANLLRRLPSVLKSERLLKAQLATLGATEAFLYPNFQIDLSFGTDVLNPFTVFSSLIGNLTGPIFNANRIKNTIALEEEQYYRTVLDYEQAYLLALQEVENAVIAIETYEAEVQIRANQLALAQEAYDLAWVRYNEGATSFLEFLNVQTSLFDVQLSASESYKSQLQSIVQLYLALGGGW